MSAQSGALNLVEKIRWLETEVDRLKNVIAEMAAAEAGTITVGDHRDLAMVENLRDEVVMLKDKLATAEAGKDFKPIYDSPNNQVRAAVATAIERCAQIADRLTSSKEIARRIRALKDK